MFNSYTETSLELHADRCINCKRCMQVCPHAVFTEGREHVILSRPAACMECGACAKNCPVQAIEDFSRAIALDSTNALTYFNRAILRTQIGDYNRALDDYNRVAFYSPNNVLVYYNRAALYAQLGDYEAAIRDYSRAIELYPDFANASAPSPTSMT